MRPKKGKKSTGTAAQIFQFLNGYEYITKKKKDAGVSVDSDQVFKSGLSYGSLSGYHSLYNGLHEGVIDLIVDVDKLLGSAAIPEQQRRVSWEFYMYHAEFPEEWPTHPLYPS